MLKGLSGLTQLPELLKQAQAMGGRMQQLQEELKQRRVSGQAGGGLVTVETTAAGETLGVHIAPELFAKQDRELLEDLLRTACNDAQQKARQVHAEALQALTGGINLPGLSEALGNLGGSGGIS